MINRTAGSGFIPPQTIHQASEHSTTPSSLKGRECSFPSSSMREGVEEIKTIVNPYFKQMQKAIDLKNVDRESHLTILKLLRSDLQEDLASIDNRSGIGQIFKSTLLQINAKIGEVEKQLIGGKRTFEIPNRDEILFNHCTEAIERNMKKALENTNEVLSHQLREIGPLINEALEHLLEKQETKTMKANDFLIAIDGLNLLNKQIQKYASIFEKNAPEIHQAVQLTMKRLESKMKELEIDLCKKMKENYQPDPKTPGDGSCMFWSIQKLHGAHETQKFYRETAADYIINHPDDTYLEFSDQMEAYLDRAYGSREVWKTELIEKDSKARALLYAEALVKGNNSVWGGTTETIALSKALEVPILTFTKNEGSQSWRLDVAHGRSEFKNKPPILLYYDGGAHYQSLIPK